MSRLEEEDGVLHALGATGPVAIVEVHLLALQDEGAHAILYTSVSRLPHGNAEWRTYLGLRDLFQRYYRHICMSRGLAHMTWMDVFVEVESSSCRVDPKLISQKFAGI